MDLGLSPLDFHIIPSDQDLYVVQFVSRWVGPSKPLKVPKGSFLSFNVTS